jgi:CRP/FNR family transcriptional regulator, cyclic AMP receptor protein
MKPSADELRSVPVLASLLADELEVACQYFTARTYQKNAIFVTEGDQLEFYYLILAGSSQAFWRDDEGHQLMLGIDSAGAHFPDLSLTGEPAAVSYVALSDLRLACIRLADFKQLMQRHPRIAEVMLIDVATRLRRLLGRAKMLTMEDVYGRVVSLLLAGTTGTSGELIAERLTHAEIGQRIGATREMVGRVLRELAKGGYVRAEPDRIVILRKPPARW